MIVRYARRSWRPYSCHYGQRYDALGISARASRRQPNNCCGETPLRRATSDTFAPGFQLSMMMRAFSSSDHCRRRPVPVITSIRRTSPVSPGQARRPCFQAYAQAYGQIDRSWAGIKPRPEPRRNVGADHRLRDNALRLLPGRRRRGCGPRSDPILARCAAGRSDSLKTQTGRNSG